MAKRKTQSKDSDGLTGVDVKASFQPVTTSVLEEYADEYSFGMKPATGMMLRNYTN